MKEVLGYFVIAQAILTGIVVYSIWYLSEALKESAAFIQSGGNMAWGGSYPLLIWVLLAVVVVLGLFLVLSSKLFSSDRDE